MRLIVRDDYHFNVIKGISDSSFLGIEIPPEANLRYQYDHCEVFIEEVDHKIVSYALVVNAAVGGPYIWSLATAREFRSRGFAGRMLGEIINWAFDRHYPHIELTVNVNNPAQKLYFDHGFRAMRVDPRYYGETSGLRMRRKI